MTGALEWVRGARRSLGQSLRRHRSSRTLSSVPVAWGSRRGDVQLNSLEDWERQVLLARLQRVRDAQAARLEAQRHFIQRMADAGRLMGRALCELTREAARAGQRIADIAARVDER